MSEHVPTPEDQPKPRRRLGLRALLFVSLALNLVILGIVGGAILNFSRGEDHPRMVVRDLGLGPYLMAMDPQQRKQMESVTGDLKPKLREGRQEWRDAYIDALDAIRADPFDANALRAAMARQSDLAARSREVGLDVMIRQLEAMSVDERGKFAERLKSRSRNLQGNKGRDGARPNRDPSNGKPSEAPRN
ncbi:periplasmic heavy metal sensor [Tropicimonas sp. TH_r6]|uniref:periplasmic heavy metal sensor n=1 Tax=Tropicimonas sp. TH_r6 TaxID=3082085 RepID=UPI0029532DAE|nr:periplasmic heavy metal sensor [Tropicimonas sp. TH_r6]MDV7144232.1 periplasmic heavy metal sensor [Tropicimonas sp. TH_r6]